MGSQEAANFERKNSEDCNIFERADSEGSIQNDENVNIISNCASKINEH